MAIVLGVVLFVMHVLRQRKSFTNNNTIKKADEDK